MLITGVLLALVPLAVISLTGPDHVTEVATLAWGQALGTWALYTANIFRAVCDDEFLLGCGRLHADQHRRYVQVQE